MIKEELGERENDGNTERLFNCKDKLSSTISFYSVCLWTVQCLTQGKIMANDD